ncbi:DUF916 and DUF3324 domain-containing protein [Latilactobacillus sp. 5-91]|uniref:DUF916 and DUF3324 domain-containing protein n=1 Tax=Latilactobacillus sp. 5-91 TaxID=3410924 RepID=UPI003C744D0A
MFKKRLLKNIILGVALGVVGGFGLSQQVRADNNTEKADFEIQPITSVAQVDTSLHYYDLKFKPGTKNTIKMRIQNFTDKKITVNSEIQNGMTQVGGDMKFQSSAKGLDPSAKIPLTTIATIKKANQTIHLEPQETKVVEAEIKMPTDNFNGMIAGGWKFIEYRNNKTSDQTISSNYAYMVSINLRGSHYKVYPELKYASTKPILYNSRPAMGVNIRNTQPMVLKNVHFKAVVSRKGLFSDNRLYEKEGSSMAPNSVVTLPISWAYDNMKPGTYNVAVKVTGENLWNKLPMSWTFKKTFKVSKEAAASLNKRSLQRPTNKWLYVVAANGVLLLVAAYGLYRVIKIG